MKYSYSIKNWVFLLFFFTALCAGFWGVMATPSDCSLREWLSSLQSEASILQCKSDQLEMSINLMRGANSSSLSARVSQQNKLKSALTSLRSEIQLITHACTTLQGPNCNNMTDLLPSSSSPCISNEKTPVCDSKCLNCTSNGVCALCVGNWVGSNCSSCRSGWDGPYCYTPVCSENCLTCVGPDQCLACSGNWEGLNCSTCKSGWSGANCSSLALKTEVVGNKLILVDVRLQNGSALSTCKQYYLLDSKRYTDGVYYIKPFSDESEFKVFCDMKNGGYIVFQKRFDGSLDFYLGWTSYRDGFGDVKGEHWLGLMKIHKFTKKYNSNLRIEMNYRDSTIVNAQYTTFSVGLETSFFPLTVGGFTGNRGDSMTYHNGKPFTTNDADHDSSGANVGSTANCAIIRRGAFWYNSCYDANLNGRYGVDTEEGMNWNTYKSEYGAKATMMGMIEK